MAKSTLRDISLQCLVGPMTALTTCKGKIICGCGSELSVYDLSTNVLEAKINAFSGSSIHGFREGQSANDQILLCVFGAKQACVVSINITKNQVKGGSTITFTSPVLRTKDWIWDAHWVSEKDNTSCISLALAHNSVLLWNWKAHKITKERECTENCILYCAHFAGSSWKDLIIMAGTVFNKIVLWPVGDEGDKNGGNSIKHLEAVDIMHTFSGHKGVIFSIKYHSELQRLCSVSDDRSIRMWQLSFPESSKTPPSVEDWRQMESHLMFSLYGHAARVWDVVMMSTCFASVGEDASCLLWDYKGIIKQKFKGHIGKSIWSLAASEDEKYLVTGGGDASIRVWELEQSGYSQSVSSVVPLKLLEAADDFPRTIEMQDFNTVLIMMNSGSLYWYSVREQEFHLIFSDLNFKSYSVVCPCRTQDLCAVGNINGSIRILNTKDKTDVIPKDISLFDGKVLSLIWLEDIHLLCSGPNGQCVLLEISNDVKEDLNVKVLQKLHLPTSKHRWITGACCIDSGDRSYLVGGDKDGSVYMYALMKDQSIEPTSLTDAEPLQSFHRIHGKTGVTSVCERDGSIYTTGRDGFYREWRVNQGVLVQLHGHKVLKGLEWIDQLKWSNNDFQVYGFFSAHFVVWSVSHNQQLISVHCGGGHRSWGFWRQDGMSRFVYLKNREACVVDCGSHSQQSLLRPALHGREVCDVKFVPLQRNIFPVVCSASEDTTIAVSAFMNQGSLRKWKPLAVLKGHLSSVRALALCNCRSSEAQTSDCALENFSILFSGGGRAEIRTWKLNIVTSVDMIDSSRILEPRDSQFTTPSESMPACSVLDVTKVKSNVLSGEEFMKNELACKHEHLCTHFLGESRHKKKFSSWKTKKLKLDPETRVMAISASPVCELTVLDESFETRVDQDFASSSDIAPYIFQRYILSVAGSDGFLRILTFDEKTRSFQNLAITFYHRCCVLKTFHYIHRANQKFINSFTLSASTRGDIAIWNLSHIVSEHLINLAKKEISKTRGKDIDQEDEEDRNYIDFSNKCIADENAKESDTEEDLQPILCLKAHQSGINSLHVLQISDSSALIVSGGDDNSVSLQMILISGSDVTLIAKGSKIDAHSAQITGICLVSPSLMVSTSIDQRVSIWQLKHQQDTIEMELITCKYIDIADVSCMDVLIERNSLYLCIGGEGVCLLSFDL